MQSEQIRSFLEKFALGNHSEEEHQQFIDWLKTASIKEVETIIEEYESIAGSRPALMNANPQLIAQIEAALDQYELSSERQKSSKVKVVWLHRYRKIAAAAVLILLGSAYFLFFNKTAKQIEIVETTVPNDVKAPASNRAMITLANGQKVYLDSAVNGTLAMQGNVKLVKLANGQIAYQTASGETINEIKYNTLTNPRGSKVINMTLADGSQVWLNAGSSVTYPVAFVGNERKVAITGEAYFEVAHNTAMPFKVSKGEMEVTVLGTHFNINAYNDEDNISTTLIEGSVKVSKDKVNIVLQPGQQSRLMNEEFKVIKNVNTEEITSWKDGWFHFESADLKTILRQFARWYDVEVVYEGSIRNRKFFGIVKRSSTLKTVLEMLQDNDIVYRIEGKKLIVKSG